MTLVNLYRKTLEALQVVAAGESAAPEDTAFIAMKYVDLWNLLLSMGLVSWGVDEAVPDEAALPLVEMLKYAAADEFGAEKEQYAAAGAVGMPTPSLAERQLRQVFSRAYVSAPARSEYF